MAPIICERRVDVILGICMYNKRKNPVRMKMETILPPVRVKLIENTFPTILLSISS